MTFVYKADPVRGREWKALFEARAPDIDFRIWPDIGDPAKVRFLAAWIPPDSIPGLFPNLEILFSVGAGIDQIRLSEIPAHVPVVRMIEPGISDRMVEYVSHAVLDIHRQFPMYQGLQAAGIWRPAPNKLASEVRVGVLGLGTLGQAVLSRLRVFDYHCSAWSRTERVLEGVDCYSGNDGLKEMLRGSDILICLLPLTAETRGILSHELLGQLPAGASLIQVGRGAHLDLKALVSLLDDGHLDRAYLDVTEPEPLPADHPLWRHPRVRITPHIASTTHPATAVPVVLENLERHRAGLAPVGVVDRRLGY